MPYGRELKDAGGEGPNTILGTGSGAYLGELIAVTTPSGTLGDGDFDVVFDTCRDGMVDTADTIFRNVIHVDVPDVDVPPVDPSIRRLKDAAREEYERGHTAGPREARDASDLATHRSSPASW